MTYILDLHTASSEQPTCGYADIWNRETVASDAGRTESMDFTFRLLAASSDRVA
jgi:hypothetical protein